MRVLLVCMGNICRSPMAEGIFRLHGARSRPDIEFDSAGTHDYHVGAAPDPRARQICAERAVDISGLRARALRAEDARFDWLLAADRHNLARMRTMFPDHPGLRLMLDESNAGLHDPRAPEVPDPYYGDLQDFEAVFDLLHAAAPRVLKQLLSPA